VSRTDPSALDGRAIAVCGTCNARDLGGLPLRRGGTTAFRRVVRADAPLRHDEGDAIALAGLGLTTVVDLRDPDELAREPNALAGLPGVDVVHVDLWEAVRPAPPTDPWDLTAWYRAALDRGAPAFARALTTIADAPGAALVHCTVGKDRTGLVVALILELAGVPRATVLADYALTHDRIEPVRTRLVAQAVARGVRREDFVRVLGATPDILAGALHHLDAHHGGADAYVARAGVEPVARERLVAKLAPPG